MQVLHYLLDDVSEYLKSQKIATEKTNTKAEEKGCLNVLQGFLDYISVRERENFRSRRHENEHSVTLTTIHQVFFLSHIILLFSFRNITLMYNCLYPQPSRIWNLSLKAWNGTPSL